MRREPTKKALKKLSKQTIKVTNFTDAINTADRGDCIRKHRNAQGFDILCGAKIPIITKTTLQEGTHPSDSYVMNYEFPGVTNRGIIHERSKTPKRYDELKLFDQNIPSQRSVTQLMKTRRRKNPCTRCNARVKDRFWDVPVVGFTYTDDWSSHF